MSPKDLIATDVLGCNWDTAPFFLFSDNVFSPLIYYSHLVPAIAGLILAFLVWRRKEDVLVNKLFIFLSLTFAIWCLMDLTLWAHESPSVIMFVWSALIYINPVLYIASAYLLYTFVKGRDVGFNAKLGAFMLMLPVLIFAPTSLNLVAFDYTNCDREALEGVLWTYVYFVEVVLVAWMAVFGLREAIREPDRSKRIQIILLSIGLILFLLAFSSGNIVGSLSENWALAQYGLFGMPIFLGVVIYLIVKFQTFKVQVIATTALVASLWMLLFSILFLQTIASARPIIIVTLIVFALLGVFLVRSVKREMELRLRIESIAADLERANEQQSTLIRFITHQLKGFMAKSRGIFSMIQEGDFGPVPDQLQPLIEEGLRSSTKGAQTIQEILNAANIKSGKVEYANEPYNFSEVITSVVAMLKPNADAKQLTLTITGVDTPLTIRGDRMQMENAVKNLIDNSIKYTLAGTVDVKVSQDKGIVRLVIKDTGVGITPEDMQNLFTEGGHGKESQKVNVDSTGFGLYIVKNIVEAHKGKVWAESEGAGKGATFTVELPVSGGEAAQ